MSMVEKSARLPDRSTTRIERREERGGVVIRLEGPINEHFDRLAFVASSTNRIVIVDFDAVGWITSFGIREWVSAIKEIPKSYLAFINVRPAVLQQFNMLTSFAGDGELVSFYAPYSCPRCNHYQERLIDLLELHPMVKRWQVPAVACDACRHDSELDDVAESYLAYVAQARPPSPPPEYHEVLRGAPDRPTPGQRLAVEKLVEGRITVLLVSGELGARASFKRAAAGLEGTVALSLSGVRTYDREGLERLRPLWQDAGPDVLLIEAPLPLAAALPDDAWRRFKVQSLRAEMQCAQGHLLKDALLQNDELWRLVRGTDPLKCPSCGEPLAASGITELAAAGRIAAPDPDTERAVAAMIEGRRRPQAAAGFAAEPFGQYTLLEMLGVGGMAEVYLARRGGPTESSPPVVVKRLLPHLAHDGEFIEMFLQEARLAARIRHPNVVQIFDVGHTQRAYYIAMEYVQGWDLARLLAHAVRLRRPFPLHLAAWICSEVAAGLEAAHGAQGPGGEPAPILHRDVSPHNVLISRDGVVKLTDFGIAKAMDGGSLTPTATLKGKLPYMAPEVVLGHSAVDTRADLFPLGVILYELITLEKMFRRSSDYATIHALLHDRAPRLSELRPDVPAELDRIGLRILARSPEQRYASARELRDELRAWLAGHGQIQGTPTDASLLAEYLGQLSADASHLRHDRPEDSPEEQITIEY